MQDDPGNIARSGGFAIRCVIVPSDAERGMAQTTGGGLGDLVSCTPPRRTWFVCAAKRDPLGTRQRPFNPSRGLSWMPWWAR